MAAGGKPPPEDGRGGRERHLQEFELYETRSNFYMIGMDEEGGSKRVLKIDRLEPSELNLCEDETVYSAKECRELLKRIHEGNKSTGGLKFVTNCYGIIGFAKFLGPYYMLLITKRRPVGEICGHVIYTVTESRIVTISSSRVAPTASEATYENRYKKLLCMVDLTKDFFFSYSFHVMLSLQKNFSDSQKGESAYETMFVWNEFLTRGIRNHLKNSLWTVALVYGYFKQAKYLHRCIGRIEHQLLQLQLSVGPLLKPLHAGFDLQNGRYTRQNTCTVVLGELNISFCSYNYQSNLKLRESGKEFKLTLIARRSRHYAGTRFMKRGVNEKGSVANDVETEQIVFEDVPGEHPSQISSVVQYRGSIPLFWSQETSKLNLKPDIVLQEKDPKFEATKLHFENLVERYGSPIIILNLIKTHERKPRESKLWVEFANAIESINRHLSEEDYLRFLHWDLSRYSKMDATAALAFLGKVAGSALKSTGFFHCQLAQHGNSGPSGCILNNIQNVDNQGASYDSTSNNLVRAPILQRGVLRTNCIDCLDRTNVAQYAYGLAALGCQLHMLGLIENSKIDPDDPLTNELMNSYETMGDTLALQYTGSAAHNKIFSERRGHWKAAIQSQEFFRTLQRYYSNAYMDAEKQAAINVFLGQSQPNVGEPSREPGSDQPFKPVRRANGATDEISRSVVKRSHSDGNVSSEYKVLSGTNHHQRSANSPVLNGVTHDGSHNGLLSSQSEVYSSDGSIFFSSKLSVDSDRICSDSGHVTNHVYERKSSNFLDLSWLSSSESSWDEERFKSSLSTGSPVQEPSGNLINASDGEIVPVISDGLSLQEKKSANIESSDDVGNMSEHFVHWVISGGTFHY